MSTPPTTHTNSIGYLLKLAQHTLRLQMDAELKSLDLTTPQYAVLSQLKNQPHISNAELARASFLTPQTMHGIVSNLERRNLIERKPDPDHGRALLTKLTRTGATLIKKAHDLIQQSDEKTMNLFSKSEQQELKKALIKIIQSKQLTLHP